MISWKWVEEWICRWFGLQNMIVMWFKNSCIPNMNTWIFLVNQSQDTAFVFLLRLEFLRFWVLRALPLPSTSQYHDTSFQKEYSNTIVPSPVFHLIGSNVKTCAVSVRVSGTSKNLYHTNCMHNYNILSTLWKVMYTIKLITVYLYAIKNQTAMCTYNYVYLYVNIIKHHTFTTYTCDTVDSAWTFFELAQSLGT